MCLGKYQEKPPLPFIPGERIFLWSLFLLTLESSCCERGREENRGYGDGFFKRLASLRRGSTFISFKRYMSHGIWIELQNCIKFSQSHLWVSKSQIYYWSHLILGAGVLPKTWSYFCLRSIQYLFLHVTFFVNRKWNCWRSDWNWRGSETAFQGAYFNLADSYTVTQVSSNLRLCS